MTARGRIAAGLSLLVFVAIDATRVTAHSGLRFSSPLEGSALGASPTYIQLTFVERPEPSLATIRVSDTSGQTYQVGRPELLSGDPLTLTIGVRALPRGVYLVNWRVVSAVDGHATAGVFAFGVQMEPTGPPPSADTAATDPAIEIAARALFLLGLLVVIGSATYAVLRFGEAPWLRYAVAGTVTAMAGLALLIVAQSRAGGADLSSLVGTPIGRAWIARGVAIGFAIAGIVLAATKRRWALQSGAGVIWLGACGAIGVHAFSGHAAAGRFPVAPTVIVQFVHVAAAGMWIGGLAILIAGLRGSAAGAQSRALARFSTLAAIGLALVTITGVVRSFQEIGQWQALTTAYGRLVIAKAALLIVIAALGAMNRWRNLPAAAADNTRPLRRTARAEIAFAVLAIVAAGALATLPPPAAANAWPGIEASGADFATTVKATLAAVSDQPGPNRFNVSLEDYDSGELITPDRVSLRFTPIDDPGVVATTLALSKGAESIYTGTGANVAFDGRWQVNVLIERGSTSADVPLQIEARGRPQTVSVIRRPNALPKYRIEVPPLAVVEIVVNPGRPGPNELQISYYGNTTDALTVRDVVVTAGNDASGVQQLVIRRTDHHQFTAAATLERGTNRISVIARTESGARLRATVALTLPGH